jgi:hypothetical protein
MGGGGKHARPGTRREMVPATVRYCKKALDPFCWSDPFSRGVLHMETQRASERAVPLWGF